MIKRLNIVFLICLRSMQILSLLMMIISLIKIRVDLFYTFLGFILLFQIIISINKIFIDENKNSKKG